jgi:hypothetical protein
MQHAQKMLQIGINYIPLNCVLIWGLEEIIYFPAFALT